MLLVKNLLPGWMVRFDKLTAQPTGSRGYFFSSFGAPALAAALSIAALTVG
jgi:hypothetical protein